MLRWLIFSVMFAAFAVHAASAANAREQQSVAVNARPVSTRPLPAAQPAQQSAAVRHLSDEERAELRRQLQQFNRQYGKRS